MTPYFQCDFVTLYLGDCREIIGALPMADACIADPPYNETNLEWDVWPEGWTSVVALRAVQMWCFGSMRMFLDRVEDFSDWKFAQDVIWEKHNGSGMHADRFRRVHEIACHFYRGDWSAIFKEPPVIEVPETRKRETLLRATKPAHWKGVANAEYEYNGKRLQRSVIPVRSCHGYAENETQKPEGLVWPLLAYSVPVGGLLLVPFAGSGTELAVARKQGKRAIGIEKRESQCEVIAQRLSQGDLQLA